MGQKPNFSPSTKSSKISLGRLWRPWSGTSGPKPGREGGGGSRRKGSGPGGPPVPCTLVLHLPSVLPHHRQNAPLSAPSWPAHRWPRKKCPAMCDHIEECMKNRSHAAKRGLRAPTPTQGATQQSVDSESLTPTQGAMQQSVDSKIVPVSSIAPEGWGPKEGGNAISPCILGGPRQRGQNQKSKPTLGVTMMPLVSQSMNI